MAEIAEQIFDNKSHLSHKSYYIPMLLYILLSTKNDTTNEKPTKELKTELLCDT